MEFGPKKFREIDLLDFMNFFGLDFFKFSVNTTRNDKMEYIVSSVVCTRKNLLNGGSSE